MRVSRKVLFLLPLLVVALVAMLRTSEVGAGAPYVDAVLARTSAHVDYVIPAGVQAAVGQDQAIATARRYANAPASAIAHSARLGFYSDLADRNLLVWVVDLEGISRPAHRQLTTSSVPPRIITREVWMISASEPGKAIASFAALPPLR